MRSTSVTSQLAVLLAIAQLYPDSVRADLEAAAYLRGIGEQSFVDIHSICRRSADLIVSSIDDYNSQIWRLVGDPSETRPFDDSLVLAKTLVSELLSQISEQVRQTKRYIDHVREGTRRRAEAALGPQAVSHPFFQSQFNNIRAAIESSVSRVDAIISRAVGSFIGAHAQAVAQGREVQSEWGASTGGPDYPHQRIRWMENGSIRFSENLYTDAGWQIVRVINNLQAQMRGDNQYLLNATCLVPCQKQSQSYLRL